MWEDVEYDKLEQFDRPTPEQPPMVFLCHQADGRICAGWAGCHDMGESLGVRIAAITGALAPEAVQALHGYSTDAELWDCGAAAAAHGRRDIAAPGPSAVRTIEGLERKRARRARAGI